MLDHYMRKTEPSSCDGGGSGSGVSDDTPMQTGKCVCSFCGKLVYK